MKNIRSTVIPCLLFFGPQEREKAVTFAETLAHSVHIFSPKHILKGNLYT